MNRIDKLFGQLGAAGKAAFIPYLTAGDPSLEATAALILEFERRGADLIELGFPFSDPVADGPVIQSSHNRALTGGTNVDAILDMVAGLRAKTQMPIVAMISYSIVYRRGVEQLIAAMSRAGLDGATIPDLPIEEAEPAMRTAEQRGFYVVPFVTPTTTPDRSKAICHAARGFIYYISVVGLTGTREQVALDLKGNVDSVRKSAEVPVCVGFGVSTPEHAHLVASVADGVIVGSAIIREIEKHAGEAPADIAKSVGKFVEALAAAAKEA